MDAAPQGPALDSPECGEDDRRLGEALRLLRRRAGLTIGALAEKAQLSQAMVSLLERGRATPSLRTLRLLGLALDVPVSYFFEAREEAAQRYVVRRGARRLLRLTRSGVLKEALLPPGKGLLEMYELALNPGGASGSDFMQHEGEKAGYLLSGRLRLVLDGAVELLEAGDSFRFPSSVPHMFDNPGEEVARVIWVTTRGAAP
ncbi:helix-turn-helix domain-containing protein [Roseococcus sp. DSY-14]|uniref:helix-turn-helix domain-containing protein n=1 Tax=Roseococcus sp. DSY-14 TaxID=3369650 RepID=UPI00387B38D7